MKKCIVVGLVIVGLLLMVGCAPGMNPSKNTPDHEGNVAGFWQGVWHSLIIPFAFIGTWFTDGVNIYEVHNNGFWYHFGLFFPGFIINFFIWSNVVGSRF